MRGRRVLLAICFAASLLRPASAALDPVTWPPSRPLVVWSFECSPFTFVTKNGQPTGFTIELWSYLLKTMSQEIRADPSLDPAHLAFMDLDPQRWNLTWVVFQQLLSPKSEGRFDVALGCLTITKEREARYDFSFSYLESGLGIVVRDKEAPTLGSWVMDIFLDFLKLCALLWCSAILFAHILWIFKGKLKEGTSDYLESIYDGVWYGLVTMTTVGYGDLNPRNISGRILTMMWMMIALLVFGYFTALLSAKFTEERIVTHNIDSMSDLQSKQVIVQTGAFGAAAAQKADAVLVKLADIDSMLQALVDGKGDAVVEDRPILQYEVQQQQWKDSNLVVLPHVFNNFGLGLMFPEGSKLREHVNMALLAWREDGAAGAGGEDQLHDKYFPRPRSPEADNALDKYDAIYAVSGAVVFVFLVAFVVRFGMGKCKPQRPPPPPLEGLPALLAANTTASSTLLQRMICSEAALGPKELKRLGSDCISAAAALQAGLQGSREEAPADAAGAKPPPQLPPPQPEPQGSYARLQEQPPPDQQQPQPQRSQQPWPAQESQQAQRPPPQPIAVHSPPPPTTAVQGPYGAYSMPAATVDGAPLSPLVVQSYGRGRMRVQPALTPQLHSRAPPSQPASPMASSYHRVDHI